MNIRMREDNVLLKEIVTERASGISAPDHGYKFRHYTVMGIGPGYINSDGHATPITDLKVGDVVGMNNDERHDLEFNGDRLRIVNAGSIVFVVENYQPEPGMVVKEGQPVPEGMKSSKGTFVRG